MGGNREGALAERNHCASHMELLFRFWIWTRDLGRVPTPEEIVIAFDTSIATAFRWRNAWCDANGLPIPDKRPSGSRPDFINAPAMERHRKHKTHLRESNQPGGNRHPQTIVERTLK